MTILPTVGSAFSEKRQNKKDDFINIQTAAISYDKVQKKLGMSATMTSRCLETAEVSQKIFDRKYKCQLISND
jgi:hypothetical protein